MFRNDPSNCSRRSRIGSSQPSSCLVHYKLSTPRRRAIAALESNVPAFRVPTVDPSTGMLPTSLAFIPRQHGSEDSVVRAGTLDVLLCRVRKAVEKLGSRCRTITEV